MDGLAQDRLHAYLEWAITSARKLEGRVSPADLERLILAAGYERLLTGQPFRKAAKVLAGLLGCPARLGGRREGARE